MHVSIISKHYMTLHLLLVLPLPSVTTAAAALLRVLLLPPTTDPFLPLLRFLFSTPPEDFPSPPSPPSPAPTEPLPSSPSESPADSSLSSSRYFFLYSSMHGLFVGERGPSVLVGVASPCYLLLAGRTHPCP